MNKIHAIFIVSFLMQIIFLTNMYASQTLSFDFDYVTQNAEAKTEYQATLKKTNFNLNPPINLEDAIETLSGFVSDSKTTQHFFLSCFVRKLCIWKNTAITFKQILKTINKKIKRKKNHPLYLQEVFYALLEKFTNQNTIILAQKASEIKYTFNDKEMTRRVNWRDLLNMEALKAMLTEKNFFINQNDYVIFGESKLLTNENYDAIINLNYTFFSLPFFKDWFDEYKQLIDEEKKKFYFTIGATAIVIILLSVFILHKYRGKHKKKMLVL